MLDLAPAFKASIVEVEAPPAPSLADSLSAEELAQVDAFAQQIDIANSTPRVCSISRREAAMFSPCTGCSSRLS